MMPSFLHLYRKKNNIELLIDWFWLNDFSISTLQSFEYIHPKCHSQPRIEAKKVKSHILCSTWKNITAVTLGLKAI